MAIPSPSGEESAAASHLVDRLRGSADAAYVDAAGNAVARFGHGRLHVVVLGHVDTVPGAIPVRVEADRLFGRGAVDAKGPLVAASCAAAALGQPAREALSVEVIGAVGEEAESSVGARFALQDRPAPDLLIVAEPSGWDRFALGYKGRLRAELRCERPHAHSAGPEASASERMVDAYVACRTWARAASPHARGPFDEVQIDLAAIRGGEDGLRQHARAWLGLRLPPEWPPDESEAALRAALPEEIELRRTSSERAVRAPGDSPLTRAFRAAIRAHGGRPRPVLKTGTSDANVVAEAWPGPWLAYGPGDSRLDHTPHEHLPLADLRRATAVVEHALAGLAARGRSATAPKARSSSE